MLPLRLTVVKGGLKSKSLETERIGSAATRARGARFLHLRSAPIHTRSPISIANCRVRLLGGLRSRRPLSLSNGIVRARTRRLTPRACRYCSFIDSEQVGKLLQDCFPELEPKLPLRKKRGLPARAAHKPDLS